MNLTIFCHLDASAGATNMNMPRQKVYSVEGPPPGYQAEECTSCPKLDGATSGGEECGAISGGEEGDSFFFFFCFNSCMY